MAAEPTRARVPSPLQKKSPSGDSADGVSSPSQYTRSTRSRRTKPTASVCVATVIHRWRISPAPVISAITEARPAGGVRNGRPLRPDPSIEAVAPPATKAPSLDGAKSLCLAIGSPDLDTWRRDPANPVWTGTMWECIHLPEGLADQFDLEADLRMEPGSEVSIVLRHTPEEAERTVVTRTRTRDAHGRGWPTSGTDRASRARSRGLRATSTEPGGGQPRHLGGRAELCPRRGVRLLRVVPTGHHAGCRVHRPDSRTPRPAP